MQINYRSTVAHDILYNMSNSLGIIDDINKDMKHSPNIHIILVDNGDYSIARVQKWYDPIRKKVPDMIKKLIETNRDEHILVVYYGKTVRPICPVVPLIDDVDYYIYNVMQSSFDYYEIVKRDAVIDAFKTGSIISKSEFGFLVKYEKMFIYEVD